MFASEIKALRHALGETTQQFGARFARSGRSVEDWEQGRRRPDPFILAAMNRLRRRGQGNGPRSDGGNRRKVAERGRTGTTSNTREKKGKK
jgi:transcriptional regulator with XRE-family HTH domain